MVLFICGHYEVHARLLMVTEMVHEPSQLAGGVTNCLINASHKYYSHVDGLSLPILNGNATLGQPVVGVFSRLPRGHENVEYLSLQDR